MGQRERATKAGKGQAVMAAGAGQSPPAAAHYRNDGPITVTIEPVAGQPALSESRDEVELVRRATDVLGIDHVARWMRSRIPSLNNQTPYALLRTADGRAEVERVLLKIEHGVY